MLTNPTHLYALGVDLLALLVPAHPGLGVARCLAHEGNHTPRDTDLVNGNFGEPGRSYEGGGEGKTKKKVRMLHRSS